MLVPLKPKSTVDLKAEILAYTGVAVTDGRIIVEWAEYPQAASNIFLVSTPDDINSFKKYDGVLVHGDSSSVNFVRGVEVSTDNVFLHNASDVPVNMLVYTS